MADDKQVIIITTESQLENTFSELARKFWSNSKLEGEFNERLTRRQAAKFMEISYQTMYNWTKAGILKEHGIGKSKFYLKSELIEAINEADKKEH